jgi:hypothetical protein
LAYLRKLEEFLVVSMNGTEPILLPDRKPSAFGEEMI